MFRAGSVWSGFLSFGIKFFSIPNFSLFCPNVSCLHLDIKDDSNEQYVQKCTFVFIRFFKIDKICTKKEITRNAFLLY